MNAMHSAVVRATCSVGGVANCARSSAASGNGHERHYAPRFPAARIRCDGEENVSRKLNPRCHGPQMRAIQLTSVREQTYSQSVMAGLACRGEAGTRPSTLANEGSRPMLDFLLSLLPNFIIEAASYTRRGALIIASILGVGVAVLMVAGFVYFVRALH